MTRISSSHAAMNHAPTDKAAWRWLWRVLLALGGAIVLGVLIWQAVTWSGNPDPSAENISPLSAMVTAGILVLREGLEAILVLAALTASLVRTNSGYWKPISLGAGLSFLATIATWFIVVGIIAEVNAPELAIQAGTGILAVVVLLVILNWFFHKFYWTGWISHHNRKKQAVMNGPISSQSAIFRGLVLVGFTSVYREGFEVVLFLQNLRLRAGTEVVMAGVAIGLALTAIVAVLTFAANAKLPYRKMLIFTGLLIVAVLVVMVGETIQEMQLANWISTTPMGFSMPGWLNLWFAIYPSVESIGAQILTVVYVGGTYGVARGLVRWRRRKKTVGAQAGQLAAGSSRR